MIISICLMALSSFLFAALPTYDQVGLFAPFLLLVVRLLQGLSVGGEYGAVATYMSELGLKGQRGFTRLFSMSPSLVVNCLQAYWALFC